jgi:hypothetical protein
MRTSLVSALIAVLCFGCGSNGTTEGSGGSTGSGGAVQTGSGGTSGGSTGGTGTTGGTSGGSTGGTSGGSTGGTSGGSTGGTSGGSTGGAAGRGSGGTGGAGGRGTGGAGGRGTGGAAGHGTGGAAGHGTGGGAGHPAAGAGGAATGSGGSTRDAGTTVNDGGVGQNGNPNGSCSSGVPSGGQPADVSSPTTVVGTGTAASCTFSALSAAVAKAGIITFNCGSAAVTIPVTSTLNLSTSKNTVIDGGNKVTLDGGHAVGIMLLNGSSFQVSETRLTLQHLALVNGKTTPTMPFPTAPLPCSQGYYDGQGGAVHVNDGNLTVIDCLFDGNQAAQLGPDTGGGAIYIEGSKHGAIIVGSTFTNNNAANAGGVGALFAELDIYNSLFQNNKAVGHDANNNDSSMCSINNNQGQHEIGSGGNGGAIYGDGNNFNITLCGDAVLNNAAGVNAFGGGLFFTSDNSTGVLTIIDTTMTGNTGGSWTVVSTGSVTNVGSAIGVTAKSITVTNSTLQK